MKASEIKTIKTALTQRENFHPQLIPEMPAK